MRTVLLGLVVLVAAGCGGASDPQGDAARPAPDVSDAAGASPDGAALRGTFGGDAALEGGCAWLETADGRYEVEWPRGWRVTFDPLQLHDPDGAVVATAGDRLVVQGERVDDAVTICQVGPLWRATDVAADAS